MGAHLPLLHQHSPNARTHLGTLLDLTLGSSNVDHTLLLVLEAELSLAPRKAEARALGAPDILAGLNNQVPNGR